MDQNTLRQVQQILQDAAFLLREYGGVQVGEVGHLLQDAARLLDQHGDMQSRMVDEVLSAIEVAQIRLANLAAKQSG